MEDVKKYRDDHLPVTAEVGGEGGSFADATYPAAERGQDDDLHRQADSEQPAAAADVAQNATHREQIAEGGVGTAPDPATGLKKSPEE
jgi:hypothetical protein